MSNTDEIRWHQRLEHFEGAMASFLEGCGQDDYSTLERAGLIQLFEVSFELSWKTVKDLLFVEGIEAKSPREVLREGHAFGMLDDIDTWLEALENRNLMSHTYDEEDAEKAKDLILESYQFLLKNLLAKLQERRGQA
jgi:nucleotidyltransferase substrate binding protein (TIGR01987 family)